MCMWKINTKRANWSFEKKKDIYLVYIDVCHFHTVNTLDEKIRYNTYYSVKVNQSTGFLVLVISFAKAKLLGFLLKTAFIIY